MHKSSISIAEQIERDDLAQTVKETPHLSRKDIIESIREIVRTKQVSRVSGSLVDIMTAQVIIQIYDAVNDVNKEKLKNMPLKKMANICWIVFNKHKKIE